MCEVNPLYKGDGIKELIPQRAPIMMVETFYEADETDCKTGLTITNDNIFCENGELLEPGLIEHVAQSASAHAGYKEKLKGTEVPPVGYIGEIKKFKLVRRPKVGEEVRTTIHIASEVMNVSLIKTESKVNDEIVATCQMKIFIRE